MSDIANYINGRPPVALPAALPVNAHLAEVPLVRMINIHDLVSEDGTRLERDEEHINALAADFLRRAKENPVEHPVHTPLRVILRGSKYPIIAGNNRYFAGLRVGLRDLPCIVLPVDLDSIQVFVEQFRDNALHRGYSQLEEARAICLVMEQRKCNQSEAGRLLGIPGPEATKRLKVLRFYPADLHILIGEGEAADGTFKVPFSTAYALSRLHPDEAKIRELTDKVVKGLLRRDDAEDAVAAILSGGKRQKKLKPMALKFGGVRAEVTGNVVESLKSFIAKVAECIKKLERDGTDPDYLPGLMK